MSELDDIRARFPAHAGMFEHGEGGLIRLVVASASGDEAQVYLQGAHVTHFKPRGHEPVLFLSAKSRFEPGKPIRGGIPIIFPWFGPHPTDSTAPQHGFARTLSWEPFDIRAMPSAVELALRLGPSDQTRKWLPSDFELVYRVTVGREMVLSLTATNHSDVPLVFEEALHTYLSIGDVRQVTVDGLSGRTFIDKVDGGRRKVQPKGEFRITGETDRVYLDTTDTLTISDPVMGRKLVVSKTGSQSTVVWNPWIEKAKAMSDFGDDEWPRMLCIETANAADNRITLAPGASHTMRATISVEPL